MKPLAADLHQIRRQAPAPLVVVIAMLLFGPQLALMSILLAQYSRLHVASVLIEWAPLIVLKLALLIAIGFVKVPVQADAVGLRFAWVYRMAWSDIVSAQIRHRFGLRLLEIRHQDGRTWRIWLYWFFDLPMFLATHAPLDCPAHHV